MGRLGRLSSSDMNLREFDINSGSDEEPRNHFRERFASRSSLPGYQTLFDLDDAIHTELNDAKKEKDAIQRSRRGSIDFEQKDELHENKEYERHIGELVNKLDEIQSKYLEATEENKRLIQELEALKSEWTDTQSIMSQITVKNNKIIKQMDEINKEQMDEMNDKYLESTTKNVTLSQKLDATQTELEKIKSSEHNETTQELLDNVDALKAECKILKENEYKMEQQIVGIKAINDGMQKMLKDISAKNESLSKKLKLKDNELKSTEVQMMNSTEVFLDELRPMYIANQGKCDELQQNVDSLKSECKILKENGHKMEQRIEGLVKKVEEREEEIKAINNGSDGMQKMIKDVIEQNESLLKKLKLKDDELESVNIENDKHQKQIDEMTKSTEVLLEKLDKAMKDLEELKSSNTADNEQYDKLQQNVDALKSECNELRVSKNEMETEYEQQIEGLVKKLNAIKNDLRHANDESTDTQKKMNEIKEENVNLMKQLNDLKKEKDAMQKTRDELIEQKEELEQNMNALVSGYNVWKQNAYQMEAEYERQIKGLKKKMEAKENNLNHANDESKNIQKKMHKIQCKYLQVTEENKSLIQKLDATNNKYLESKTENAKIKKKMNKKDEALGVLGMKLYDLERQKDAMQANKDEMKIENERQIEEFIKKMKDNEINLIHSNDERAQAQKKMVMELQQIHKKKQDELKKEMNDIQNKYQKIANLSTTLQHQMNDLKEEKKTMQITIDALVSHVQQNEKLEKNIDAMKVKYKALKQNGDKMEVEYVQQIECLAMQSKENENLITTLNQSVSALKSECNQLRVDKDKMEAEHERQLQHIEELVKKLENHDLKHANDANLQKKMNEKDEAMGVLGMKLYELERQKDAMQKTMDRLIEQKKALEQNVNTLASDNKVSKENAVEYERQIAELMKELKHANDERNKITKENVDFSDKLQATVSNAMNGKIDLFMDEFRK